MKTIGLENIKINNGFWRIKQEMVNNITLKSVYERFSETHRFSALKCEWKEGDPNLPHVFWDSDVAKWIEGAAYILHKKKDPDLEVKIEEIIDEIEKNQCADGYFNSHFITCAPEKRFTNRDWHELYCAGHLMEAAVA